MDSGTYQLNITDNVGCPFEENYTISSAAALTNNTFITNVSSNNSGDGSIDLTVNGGAPPTMYINRILIR